MSGAKRIPGFRAAAGLALGAALLHAPGAARAQSLFESLFNQVQSQQESSGGGQSQPGEQQQQDQSQGQGQTQSQGQETVARDPNSVNGSQSQSQSQSSWGAENSSGTVWGSGAMSNSSRTIPGGGDGWCDREVALADERMRAQVIEARTALARQNFTLAPQGMLSLSCVDRILNSGLNFFNLDFLDSVMNNIRNAFSCQRVLRMVNSYANQQISTYVGGAMSQAVGAGNQAFASTGIGQAIPGISLGTFTGNINTNPAYVNIGGAGSNTGTFVNFGQSWGGGGSAGFGRSGFGSGSGGGSVNMGSSLLGSR